MRDIGDDSDGHIPHPLPTLLLTDIHAHLSCIFQKDWKKLDLSGKRGGFITLWWKDERFGITILSLVMASTGSMVRTITWRSLTPGNTLI